MGLATTEFARMVDALDHLSADDWGKPTVCSLWNVQAMVAHVVGMAEAQASFPQFLHDFRAAGKRSGGAMIDALNATQVRDRADQTPAELARRLKGVTARAVRSRTRTPSLMRKAVRFKQDPPFEKERWAYGFLVDTIDLHARHVDAPPRHLACNRGRDGRDPGSRRAHRRQRRCRMGAVTVSVSRSRYRTRRRSMEVRQPR